MFHALITGANRGLGLEHARQLLERGWHVTAAVRDPDAWIVELDGSLEKNPFARLG